jgi:hypothetical protein
MFRQTAGAKRHGFTARGLILGICGETKMASTREWEQSYQGFLVRFGLMVGRRDFRVGPTLVKRQAR